MTLKPWLEVTQTGTIPKLGCNIVTMAVSCIIIEIKRYIGQKSSVFHTPLHSMPPVGESPSVYCLPVWYGQTRMMVIDCEKSPAIWLPVVAHRGQEAELP